MNLFGQSKHSFDDITPQGKMALALSALGKPFYAGTVPAAVVARRRAKNKAARRARRNQRGSGSFETLGACLLVLAGFATFFAAVAIILTVADLTWLVSA